MSRQASSRRRNPVSNLADLAKWCDEQISYLRPFLVAPERDEYDRPLKYQEPIHVMRELVGRLVDMEWESLAAKIKPHAYGLPRDAIGLLARIKALPDEAEQIMGTIPPQAAVKSDRPVPLVVLGKREDRPIVMGKRKAKLTTARYDVVKALLDAGAEGLNKDEIVTKSRHGDARQVLKRLAASDPDWKSVIVMAGVTGGGYRIRSS